MLNTWDKCTHGGENLHDGKIQFMTRVAILGSTGMLGTALTKVLERDFEGVTEFNRIGKSVTGKNQVVFLDVLKSHDLLAKFYGWNIDYVVNAIGMIKQLINEDSPEDIWQAREINSDFALRLNEFALQSGIQVIQIGTDCVYSGLEGSYSEADGFDPTDTYGKTKHSGEQALTESMIIRTSIIGKESDGATSLLSWVLSQPFNGTINGYTNHMWNGVTTKHFSEVVSGVIKSGNFRKGVTHLVPGDTVSKYELIKIIASEFGRKDLRISEYSTEKPINRTLVTLDPARNLQMWQEGGYTRPPAIQEMVSEYEKWTRTQ